MRGPQGDLSSRGPSCCCCVTVDAIAECCCHRAETAWGALCAGAHVCIAVIRGWAKIEIAGMGCWAKVYGRMCWIIPPLFGDTSSCVMDECPAAAVMERDGSIPQFAASVCRKFPVLRGSCMLICAEDGTGEKLLI